MNEISSSIFTHAFQLEFEKTTLHIKKEFFFIILLIYLSFSNLAMEEITPVVIIPHQVFFFLIKKELEILINFDLLISD